MAKIKGDTSGFSMVGTHDVDVTRNVLPEECFNRVIYRERKRVERTGESMLLLVLDVSRAEEVVARSEMLESICSHLANSIRDTDALGWLRTGSLLGIVYTGIKGDHIDQARQTVKEKTRKTLYETLPLSLHNSIALSVLTFPHSPDDREGNKTEERFSALIFYPEIFYSKPAGQAAECAKRAMDVAGSIVALVLFSPLFIIVPILIKITSPGPVFFRQLRLGRFGRPFSFLKFRSMYHKTCDEIHREFIKGFITNNMADTKTGEKIYKITKDPRITPIGSFLRKSSIDELPQLINVLKGEMSLVGPRPPIPYEVDVYNEWHFIRILARKPGITGLWQVRGRSLTTFDGMVRLDLEYIRNWSLWLDIKLLLETPLAVLRSRGAY